MSQTSSEAVVEGYIKRASLLIIKEQGFVPSSVKELEQWLAKNAEEITNRANQAMQDFALWLVGDSESAKKPKALLSEIVYNQITENLKKNPRPVEYNERYLDYCKENGCTPEEMKVKDNGRMTNFICWTPKS